MDEGIKKSIDDMDYRSMFQLWQFAPTGHAYLCGDEGEYFIKIMQEKRDAITDAQHTAISKEIGWKQ